jgi:hypothetical protein
MANWFKFLKKVVDLQVDTRIILDKKDKDLTPHKWKTKI